MGGAYPYTVEQDEDGKYTVQFLDFDEGFTEGDTLEEAAANAQEVLSVLALCYADDGKALPTPSAAGRNPVAMVWFQ